MTLLLVLACATENDAARYTRALHAGSFEAGMEACAGVTDERARHDCTAAVIERHARFEGCEQISDELWRSECFFQASEQRARTGDFLGALQECARGNFAENCDGHVLEMAAMNHLHDELPDAARVVAALEPALAEGVTTLNYWRSWFRNRIYQGLPVDGEACADKWCHGAARHEMEAAVASILRREGPRACAEPLSLPWAVSEDAKRRVQVVQTRNCGLEPAAPPG